MYDNYVIAYNKYSNITFYARINELINCYLYSTLKYRILPFRYHFPLHLFHFFLYFSFFLCHSLLCFIIIFLSLRMSFSSSSLLSRFPPFGTLPLLCHLPFPLLPILSSILFLRHSPFFFAIFHYSPFAQQSFFPFSLY